jgi:UDPglucose--hexose-1-phosphate uridylyltransferase
MPELRKDYILDRWVIISPNRAKRPHDFKQQETKKEDNCVFCPGNEHLTTKESYRLEENGKWLIRVFENKFPIVQLLGDEVIKTKNKYFSSASAFGKHEVLVETPNSNQQLWDLTPEHIEKILNAYLNRISKLSQIEDIKYVQIFKNHKQAAGTSIVHSHSQIIAYNKVPKVVEEEVKKSNTRPCPYCEIVKVESKSERRCFENDNFVAFTPFASRFPYHLTKLAECNLEDLSEIMKKVLSKLKRLNAPYNFIIHNSPTREDNLHFHIEFLPRLSTWAGFEFSGTIINSTLPEKAAKFYRE